MPKTSADEKRLVPKEDNKVSIERHIQVKIIWRNGEVSWVAADALKEQNPWVLVNYAMNNKLTNHPDFSWTLDYMKNRQVVANTATLQALAAKTQGDTRFKFGVQVPKNASHASHLDEVEKIPFGKKVLIRNLILSILLRHSRF